MLGLFGQGASDIAGIIKSVIKDILSWIWDRIKVFIKKFWKELLILNLAGALIWMILIFIVRPLAAKSGALKMLPVPGAQLLG